METLVLKALFEEDFGQELQKYLRFLAVTWINQKQPYRSVLRERCSENMQRIYRRISMPKCDFNKVASQLY